MIELSRKETWVGVFDILGFKTIIEKTEDEFHRLYLESQLDDIFEVLNSEISTHGELEFVSFSDTFVIFTQSLDLSAYPWFLLQCTQIIERSIEIQLPVRGSISVGIAYTSTNPIIITGKPFVEAFEYAEDQDWVGLLLTPTATKALRAGGLEPLYHDFVNDDDRQRI